MKIFKLITITLLFSGIIVTSLFSQTKAGADALGSRKYDEYKTPQFCGSSCHVDFYQQWKQAMMSQAYIHHWDEIEYFKLAVPHAEKDPLVAQVNYDFTHEYAKLGVGFITAF